MSIDWSKAPHDAEAGYLGTSEHYSAWYRRDGIGQVQQICPSAGFNEWTWMGGRTDFPIGAELRPLLGLEWNGEGLPPVGTVCEVQTWVNREWRKTTVLAHHLGFAVHSWSTDGDDMEVEAAPARDFRPIRTPEQIAAEEALLDIERLYSEGEPAAVFDAGYRKPEAK